MNQQGIKKAIQETFREGEEAEKGAEVYKNKESLWELIKRDQDSESGDEPVIKGVESGQYFSFIDGKRCNEPNEKKFQVFHQRVKLGTKHLVLITLRDFSKVLELERQKQL